MQVFEFHFNPKIKEGIILDSFVYEPENVYEKNLGNLFVAGQLTNALPQNYQFLNNLASVIKKNYYLISAQSSPEKSFKKSLGETNDFLEKEEKKGNISWLGNLDLAIISLKEFNLNFTKVGDIKILLARGNEIIDIGKELESKESELPSLKTFSNIVAGKLAPEDKIIILSKEIFNIFEKENVFSEIIEVFEDNGKPKKIDWELKKVLDKKKSILTENSGLFLLIALGKFQKETKDTIEVKKPVMMEKETSLLLPFFLVKKFIGKKLNKLSKIKNLFKKLSAIKNILDFPKKKIKEVSKRIEIPVLKEDSLSKVSDLKKTFSVTKQGFDVSKKVFAAAKQGFGISKKAFVIIIILAVVLVLGNYIFKFQKQKGNEEFQTALDEIQKIVTDAENALIYNDQKKANLLYQEAFNKILPLSQEDKIPQKDKVSELKEKVEKELFLLNNLEEISEPKMIFEFKPEEFSPQKMMLSGSELYFWDLNFSKVYILEMSQNEEKITDVSKKVELGTKMGNYVLFFAKPNQLILLSAKELNSINDLEFPLSDFNPVSLSVLGANIYFLDSQKGEIVKFKLEEEKNQLSGEIWLNQETRKPLESKSMAIDGSIWISSKDNTLLKYYKGDFQEEINLDFFPPARLISKIFTTYNLSYLYLLTPTENRIVILNKDGKVFKQYQSDKFNNLKDFAVSEDGKIIYLLNDLKIYQITP